MKRQLPSTSSVDEPQRNVRNRNLFTPSMPIERVVSLDQPHVNIQPGIQFMAPNLHADCQSPTSVSGESTSSSSDTPQGLPALAGFTPPRVCTQCRGLLSAQDERGNYSLSSEIPAPASDPWVPSTSLNPRSNIHASEERSIVSFPSTSPVDEPQRHVRSRNPFARSTARHLSSGAPAPASDPWVPSTSLNPRSNIPASEERSTVSFPSTSPVDEPQRHVRSRNPFARSTARHFRVFTQQERQRVVFLEQPHGFQPGIQSVAPNMHADHQSPTSVPGESISGSSDAAQNLPPFDGSIAPRVFAQHQSRISAPYEMGISLSSEVSPPASDSWVPSTAPQLRSRFSLIPVAPPWIAGISYTRVILRPVAPPVGSRSLDRIAVSHLSEQPQNRTSQEQTNNHSQYQNPQIIPAVQHHDMRMDINRMSYEELLALEERIGKVNTGIKTSELSKFVKKIICCGEQDEAEQCVICLEQYADADAKGQLKCGHEYHFSCIGKWMEEQAVCPICRQRAAHFEQ